MFWGWLMAQVWACVSVAEIFSASGLMPQSNPSLGHYRREGRGKGEVRESMLVFFRGWRAVVLVGTFMFV
jgi:ketopantoate hydroxymethyltransferase